MEYPLRPAVKFVVLAIWSAMVLAAFALNGWSSTIEARSSLLLLGIATTLVAAFHAMLLTSRGARKRFVVSEDAFAAVTTRWWGLTAGAAIMAAIIFAKLTGVIGRQG